MNQKVRGVLLVVIAGHDLDEIHKERFFRTIKGALAAGFAFVLARIRLHAVRS